MARQFTAKEELLTELVYVFTAGTGMPLRQVKQLLQKSMSNKDGMSCLDCLDRDGRKFINEVITFLNESEK